MEKDDNKQIRGLSKQIRLRFKKAIELSEVKPGEKVLDLGCGNKKLKEFLPKVEYLGVDVKKYNGVLQHNLEKGLPKKIKKQKFDIIFMLEFLEHIENFKSLLKECKKIMSKKGRIIVSTPNYIFCVSEDMGHIHKFTKSNMRNLAKECNLKITKISGTYIHIPIIHFQIPSSQTFYNDVLVYRLE